MLGERLAHLPAAVAGFSAAPPADDRGRWTALPDWVRGQILADGEAALMAPYPLLLASDYLAYSRMGDRVGFEAKYFARRRRLNALALAECVEHRGRFLDRIADGVMLLCDESGWQLPAHNAQVRNGTRDALPDPERPIIDLFAAETGAQLAVLAHLLGTELDAVTPEIVRRIDRELEQRIFTPYLSRHFWWMGDGDERMNNWTAWCTQNVLLAACCRPLDGDRRRQIVAKAAASLDAFLKDYADDGACEEGVHYYRHAGLCLFNSLVVLSAVAPEAFATLWREPKIRNIAEYIVHMHVGGRRYFNFADSSAVVEACGAREFLFGKAVGSTLLADFAARDWATDRRATLPDEINLFYRVQAAFTAAEVDAHRGGPVRQEDRFLPGIGLLVARDKHFALAVKAGNNGESHNHNDVGSVILYKDGQPVLIDIGVETYTARTFSAERYEIWTKQSAWHNLPSFGGVMQRDGAEFAARDVEVTLEPQVATFTADIAGAYPAEARLRSYRRRVTMYKGRSVEIEDTHDGDRAAELSLMFAMRPELSPASLNLPGLATIALDGAGRMRLEEIAITDARLRTAWPERLYRVLVPFSGRRLRLAIT
jgi:hypothetical protein